MFPKGRDEGCLSWMSSLELPRGHGTEGRHIPKSQVITWLVLMAEKIPGLSRVAEQPRLGAGRLGWSETTWDKRGRGSSISYLPTPSPSWLPFNPAILPRTGWGEGGGCVKPQEKGLDSRGRLGRAKGQREGLGPVLREAKQAEQQKAVGFGFAFQGGQAGSLRRKSRQGRRPSGR